MWVMEWDVGLITAAGEAGHLWSRRLEDCSALFFYGEKKGTKYFSQTLRYVMDLTEKMVLW